jgi:beta-mannosidase
MLVHQKAHLGNVKLARGASGHLPETTTIEDWHWATQLNQAHAVRFGIEHFRSLTPHNSGTIVWQLNDNWPVVSWAAVDFDEHRKPLWHALRAAYAPRLATLQPRASEHSIEAAFEGLPPEADATALILVNDTSEAFDGAFGVTRQLLDGTVLVSETITATVPARSAVTLLLPAEIARWDDPTREFIVANPADPSTGFATAYLFGAEVVDQELDPHPTEATAERVEGGYAVTVIASSLARDIFLNVDRVDRFASVDEGLVTLTAGGTATFRVRSEADLDPDEFIDGLVLRTANSLR